MKNHKKTCVCEQKNHFLLKWRLLVFRPFSFSFFFFFFFLLLLLLTQTVWLVARRPIYDALRHLKTATLLKLTLIHECFLTFFKLYKWYQIAQRTTYWLPSTLWFEYFTLRQKHYFEVQCIFWSKPTLKIMTATLASY